MISFFFVFFRSKPSKTTTGTSTTIRFQDSVVTPDFLRVETQTQDPIPRELIENQNPMAQEEASESFISESPTSPEGQITQDIENSNLLTFFFLTK